MEAEVEEEGGKVKVEEEAGGMESREGGNAGNCQGKGERTFFSSTEEGWKQAEAEGSEGERIKGPNFRVPFVDYSFFLLPVYYGRNRRNNVPSRLLNARNAANPVSH